MVFFCSEHYTTTDGFFFLFFEKETGGNLKANLRFLMALIRITTLMIMEQYYYLCSGFTGRALSEPPVTYTRRHSKQIMFKILTCPAVWQVSSVNRSFGEAVCEPSILSGHRNRSSQARFVWFARSSPCRVPLYLLLLTVPAGRAAAQSRQDGAGEFGATACFDVSFERGVGKSFTSNLLSMYIKR